MASSERRTRWPPADRAARRTLREVCRGVRVRGGTSLRAALARAVGVTATVALLAPAAAAAETLSSGDAVKRECAARALPPGTAGVASSAWSAPAEGLLSARLDAGPAPDWDLALLRNGEPAGETDSSL